MTTSPDPDTLTGMRSLLGALRVARATGVRRVTHGDTTTEYKTDGEMAAAIRDLERRIAGAQGRRWRTAYVNTSKGL